MASSVNLGTVHVSLELRFQRMRDGIRDAKSDLAGLETKMKQTAESITRIGRNMSLGITVPLLALGKQVVDTAVDFDGLRRALVTVMGSSEAARKEFLKLEAAARLPGLGMEEAVQGSVRLQAAGFSADFARRAMLGFGNALATVGKGKEDLDAVLYNLTQIKSMGKLTGDELRETATRIPQFGKVLLEAFGTADTRVLAKQGLGIDEILERIVQGFEKLPQASDSARNKMDNFSDTLKRFREAAGNAILPTLTSWMEGLSPKIEAATKWFKGLDDSQKRLFTNIGVALAATGPVLVGLGLFASAILKIKELFTIIAGTTFFKFLTGKIPIAGAASLAIEFGARDKVQSNVRDMLRDRVPSDTWNKWNLGKPSLMPNRSALLEKDGAAPADPTSGGLRIVDTAEADRIRRANEDLAAELAGEEAQVRLEAKRRIAEGQNRKLVNAWAQQKIAAIYRKHAEDLIRDEEKRLSEWRELQSAALDMSLAGFKFGNFAGKGTKGIPGRGPQLPEFATHFLDQFRSMDIPPIVTKELTAKLAEDLPAELGKAIQDALDKAHNAAIPQAFTPATREIVAKNLIDAEAIANQLKKATEMSQTQRVATEFGKDLGSNLAYELGYEFSKAFDKVFGVGNPLSRALNRTFTRLLDDLLYNAFSSGFGGKGLEGLFGGGIAQGGIDPMTGNPRQGGMGGMGTIGGILGLISLFAGGGIFKGIGKALSGIFRADGGPVRAGMPYIVGERGPELFVPRHAGTVVAGGAGGINITIPGLVIREEADLDRLAMRIRREMKSRAGSG